MNRVELIGNLTKDPEYQKTTTDISVTKFTLAVKRPYSVKEGEQGCDFIPIVAWRNIADNVYKFVKKGDKVAVAGSIHTRSYETNDGEKRYVTEIMAENIDFLSTKTNEEKDVKKTLPDTNILKPIDDDNLPF